MNVLGSRSLRKLRYVDFHVIVSSKDRYIGRFSDDDIMLRMPPPCVRGFFQELLSSPRYNLFEELSIEIVTERYFRTPRCTWIAGWPDNLIEDG
jgi:hypothetical protein